MKANRQTRTTHHILTGREEKQRIREFGYKILGNQNLGSHCSNQNLCMTQENRMTIMTKSLRDVRYLGLKIRMTTMITR